MGTVKKSTAIVPARWLRTNVFHVCDGGEGISTPSMYLATVSLATARPSFASSFAIRRRLHVGFYFAIRLISATILGVSGGRPIHLDFHIHDALRLRTDR
jgi:hypothetical protein